MHKTGCLVCGEPIKAKYLCSKHHQRILRTGSIAKNEEHDADIQKLIAQRTVKLESKKLNLAQYAY